MNILETCRNLFREARGLVSDAMPLLHKIFTEKLYEGKYSSFGEYVDDCGISRSQASRLVSVYQHYAIEGGIKDFGAVEPDRLYLAAKLPGTPDQQLIKARHLSRDEIRAEVAVDEHGNEHECQPITICRVCNKRM